MTIYGGKGTTVSVSTTINLGGTLQAIGQVVSCRPHGGSVGTYDITNLDSTGMREYTKTIGDGDTLEFMVNYESTDKGQDMCADMIAAPFLTSWKVQLPGSVDPYFVWFNGTLTGFSRQPATVDGLHQADLSVKISGSVTSTN